MPVSQLPQAPFRQDRKVFPTPLIGDVLFSEVRDCNRTLIPEYGTPHPDAVKWPHHKLVYAKPVDIERNEIFEFFYAADRENQDLYNFEVGRLRVGTLSVPMVKRTYISPRDSFDLTEPLLGSEMPNVPLDKFESGYILHEVNQVRAETELDSLFVREEHIYILPLTTVSRSAEDQNYVIIESHVEEGARPDESTGVVESSVMAIGNGKAVKTTKIAITDFNEGDNTYDVGFSDLKGVLFDPRYGVRVDIERTRVDPESDITGENPMEDNGVVRAISRDPESVRQARQETRLYTLPDDQVWYGSRRASNLPRVLDRVEVVDSKQNPTLIPIFEPQYDGVLPARWTRKFTFGPPEVDFNGRVYRPEEFVYVLEYERESESRSFSESTSVSESSGVSESNSFGSSTSDNSGTSNSTNSGSSTSSSSGTSESTNIGSSTSSSSGSSDSTNSGSSTSSSSGTSTSNSSGTSTSSNSGTSESTNTGSTSSSSSGLSSSSNAGTSESTNSGSSSSNSYGNQSSFSSSSSAGTSESYSLTLKAGDLKGAPLDAEADQQGESTTQGVTASSGGSSSTGNSYSENEGYSTSQGSGTSTSTNISDATSGSSGTTTSSNTSFADSNNSGSSTSTSTSDSTSDSSGSSTSDNSGISSSSSFGDSTSQSSGSSISLSSGESTSENSGVSSSRGSGSSTSENSGTSVSNSLSDSSSESRSISFGKSVLSLQIPACLRRSISVSLTSITEAVIQIPATEPVSLEDNQWVIEDISSNHWQDGIWVTEIVEVYLGNL